MHRTDAEGAVDGRFHPGNPAIGQQATRIGADWLNDVQESICFAIEQAGIALEKGDPAQLYEALVAIVAGVVGTGGGSVPTTRQLTGAGLVQAIGDLAANRTVNVPKASAAEVSALARDDVAVTPLALAGLVGLTTVGSGWVIRIGNTILQCFTATVSANANTVLTLPQTFPIECRVAFCNGGASTTSAQDNPPFVSGRGASSITVYNAVDQSLVVDVFAIGR